MTESPFDAAAAEYDAREAGNPLMQRLRARSLAALEAAFPPGSRLLDVGCGTGTEAVALARAGRRVFAIDPSERMLDALAAKAKAAGVDVPTRVLASRDVARLAAKEPFDGAYASFGGLNGEPDLAPVVEGLASVLAPGARFVTSVLNRWAVTEMACYALALRPRRVVERLRGRATWRAAPDATPMDVRYHSLASLRRAFAPRFDVERAEALALLAPPPPAWGVARRLPRVVAALDRAERRLADKPGLRGLGNHHLVTFRRRA